MVEFIGLTNIRHELELVRVSQIETIRPDINTTAVYMIGRERPGYYLESVEQIAELLKRGEMELALTKAEDPDEITLTWYPTGFPIDVKADWIESAFRRKDAGTGEEATEITYIDPRRTEPVRFIVKESPEAIKNLKRYARVEAEKKAARAAVVTATEGYADESGLAPAT